LKKKLDDQNSTEMRVLESRSGDTGSKRSEDEHRDMFVSIKTDKYAYSSSSQSGKYNIKS